MSSARASSCNPLRVKVCPICSVYGDKAQTPSLRVAVASIDLRCVAEVSWKFPRAESRTQLGCPQSPARREERQSLAKPQPVANQDNQQFFTAWAFENLRAQVQLPRELVDLETRRAEVLRDVERPIQGVDPRLLQEFDAFDAGLHILEL